MSESLELFVNGEAWRRDFCVYLPRHWGMGPATWQPPTMWGAPENSIFWPGRIWIPLEELQKREGHEMYDRAFCLRFPVKTLGIVDEQGRRDLVVKTGFIAGVLYELEPLRRVYIVLYRGGDGRRWPRMMEPTSTWLKRHAEGAPQ